MVHLGPDAVQDPSIMHNTHKSRWRFTKVNMMSPRDFKPDDAQLTDAGSTMITARSSKHGILSERNSFAFSKSKVELMRTKKSFHFLPSSTSSASLCPESKNSRLKAFSMVQTFGLNTSAGKSSQQNLLKSNAELFKRTCSGLQKPLEFIAFANASRASACASSVDLVFLTNVSLMICLQSSSEFILYCRKVSTSVSPLERTRTVRWNDAASLIFSATSLNSQVKGYVGGSFTATPSFVSNSAPDAGASEAAVFVSSKRFARFSRNHAANLPGSTDASMPASSTADFTMAARHFSFDKYMPATGVPSAPACLNHSTVALRTLGPKSSLPIRLSSPLRISMRSICPSPSSS
mmetsp:Transcript_128652/g.320880  ORF Transcript_128652/g.320880 Transcript_128652/m.320880 type:complete len:350 (+) Transcript_128652:82-1131(+)